MAYGHGVDIGRCLTGVAAPPVLLQSECEVQCIISAALILVTLMPMFPVALIDFIQDLFQVLR